MNLLKQSLITTAVLASSSAYSAGVYLHELGTNDVGLAAAGQAARAQDSSVMATNPAGLSNLEEKSFTGGLMALYGDAEYKMDNGSAGNIVGFVPLGSAFYSQPIGNDVTLGIGMYGNYGMGLEYDNFLAQKAVTQALTIQPTVSYKINDQWALGAGIGLQYGMFKIKIASGREEDDTDLAANAKLGVLFSPDSSTRLGLGYSSETELNFKVLGQPISPSVLPQTLMFSAFHQLDDKWAVMGNLGWEDWSQYQTFIKAPTQDTYHIALGSRYQLNDKTIWNMGVAFDSSMYKSQSEADFTVPTGDSWRIGTGMEYTLDGGRTLGLAFEVVLVESSEVNIAGFGPYGQGEFDNPTLYFLTATYSWSGI